MTSEEQHDASGSVSGIVVCVHRDPISRTVQSGTRIRRAAPSASRRLACGPARRAARWALDAASHHGATLAHDNPEPLRFRMDLKMHR